MTIIDGITYGCQCHACPVHPEGVDNDAPCAYLIERDGTELAVCTRCDTFGDTIIVLLVSEDSSPAPFIKYDALGALALAVRLSERRDTAQKGQAS